MQDNEHSAESPRREPSTAAVDRVVAAILFGLGALVVYDSKRVGTSWVSDGPQAGYFPFYVGLILCLASAWILAQSLLPRRSAQARFVDAGRFKSVLAMLLPAAAFVACMYALGIYVASALLIGGFMRWQGRFPLLVAVAVGVLVPSVLFALFEVWFLIPLPKGPLEELLGY